LDRIFKKGKSGTQWNCEIPGSLFGQYDGLFLGLSQFSKLAFKMSLFSKAVKNNSKYSSLLIALNPLHTLY